MGHHRPWIKRSIILVAFLVADIFLGVFWLRTQQEQVLVPVKNFLSGIHPALPEKILGHSVSQSLPSELPTTSPFTAQEVFETVNAERAERKLPPLEYSEVLSQGGDQIIEGIIENNVSFDGLDSGKIISNFLQKKKVENISLFHDTLIGPRTLPQLQQYWKTEKEHLETISSPDLTQLGVATASAMIADQEQGILVMIYAKPQPTVQSTPVQTPPPQKKKIVFPEISNQSVLEALNQYRATHKIHSLQEHPKLCEYAEKRVQDLVQYGGLDGHEGFRKDFADPEKIPQSIKDYPGGAIGENLAYQNCRNMQTNQDFLAETATALIEWCFDSSTKGHREAQLNPKFNNVCARHQDGYFVIIFGE